jgi:hypothetical protein
MKNWLDKFQEGGAKSPIYTTDKSKVKAYKDSLNLYNKGEKNFKEYQKLNKKLGIPTSSTRKWNDPVEYTKDIELSKIQPIEGYGYWYTHNPNVVTGTNIPSDLVNNLNFRYKQPTQPYILGREQEQVNYITPNKLQEQLSFGIPSNPEYLYGEEMVPYIDRVNNGQYPGGWEERGMRMEKIKYQKGGVKSPIYTTDKSKVQAYTDSLNIHNSTKGMINDLKRYENTYVGDELGKQWLKYANNWYDKNEKSAAQSFKRLTKLNKTSPSASKYYSKKDNNQVAVEYKQPIQPYIYQNRPQEQVNYLTPNGIQEQPGQGVYPAPELLHGPQLVPYTRGTVQYPGGYQEKGYELVDKIYKEGGSPKLINVMDGYMPRQDVDNTATPITPRTSGISQKQLNNELYALRTEGLRKREEEKREIESRRQAENVIDSGKGKFTLPTGETKDYSKMNFREKSYVKGEALKNRGRAFPDENSIVDDLNPLNWIGSMAGNMSQAPYVAQQTDSYIPYVTAIAEPLIMGRVMGSGNINPFGKKMWTNSISDAEFANSLLMGVPRASVKALSKLPFENVPILNEASRINPWRFKTQEGKIYRQVGKPGFEDALKEGKVYDKGQKQFLEENPNYNYLEGYNEAINAEGIYLKKPPPAPFFSKDKLFFPIDRKATGKGFKKTANSDAQYLIEGSVPDEGLFPRYMDRYLKPGESSSNTFVLKPEYNNLENFNLYERNWLEGYSKIKAPESLQNFKNIASDLKPGNFSRYRNIALNPVGIFIDYSSGLLKGVGEQITGLMKDLRISSGNASRRPFFETFPITKTQKAKVSAMQDEALNDAMEFTKNYWYANNSENIRPVLEDKIRAFVPDIKMAQTSNNLERRNPKNPFNTTEDLLIKNTTGKLEKEKLDKKIIDYLNRNRGQIGGVNNGNKSITLRNSGFYYKTPKRIGEIVVHEGGHTAQTFGPIADFKQNTTFAVDQPWSNVITKYSPKYKYYTSNADTELGRRFQKALVDPKEKNVRQTWLSSPDELHSEMMAGKYNLYKQGLKQGYSVEEMMSKVTNPSEKELLWILDNKKLNKHFKPETSLKEKLSLMKLLPAAIPVVAGTAALQEKKKGGIITDLIGQQKYPNQVSDNTQNTQLNFIPKSVEEYNRLNPNQKELEFLQNHPLQKLVPIKTPSSYYEEKEIERKKEIFKQKQYEKEGRNKEGEYKVLRKPRPELDRWLDQVGYPAFEVASLVGGVGEGYQLLKSTGKLGRLGMIKALGRDIFEKPSNFLKNNKITQGIDNTLTSIGNRANVLSLDPVGVMIDHQVAGLNTAVNVNWLWDINTGKYIPNFNGSVGNVVTKYTSDLYDGIGPDKVTSPLNTIRDLNIVKGTINPKKQFGGPIVDPRGQWKYPGQVTRIPSSNITMQGVDYPVYGVDNNGQEQMMYPGQEYNFPGADYVDEYPMMQKGGSIPVIEDAGSFNEEGIWVPNWEAMTTQAKKLGSKTIKTKNGTVIYFDNNWNVKSVNDNPVMKDGGLLSKSVTCSNCGWSWKGVEGGLDALTCHKCGGMIKMQTGGQKMPPELAYARFAAAGNLNQLGKHGYQDGGERLPNDFNKFQEFNKTLPDNLRNDNFKYGDYSHYDLYGMWDASGKPKSFDDVKDTEQFGLQEDGTYHGFSVGNDGVWLKPKSHPSAFMEYMQSQLSTDPYFKDNHVIQREDGRLQYVPITKYNNGGGIPERYKNMGFTKVGAKKQSTRPGKKWMVLAKKGDDYKVVHGGYKGMQDFKQHHSEQRRKNFWNRMGGKNSSKATDPFSPLYWHKRFGTWENGGQINQMQNGGIMMRDLEYPVYGIDRDLFNSRLQNGGNVNWLDNIN